MSFYIAVAYRWGNSNDSHYHVGGWEEFIDAQRAADAESHDRGGKYGVTVYEMTSDGSKPVYHAPSGCGEERAKFNPRLYVIDQLGMWVTNVAEGNYAGELTAEAVREQEKFHGEIGKMIADAQAKSRQSAAE